MEGALLLRSLGGLLAVLALLATLLWVVRRYDVHLPGRVGGGRRNRLAIIERLTLDPRRCLVLIRQDGCEHLLLLAPEGPMQVARSGDEPSFPLDTEVEREAPSREMLWLPPGWSRHCRDDAEPAE